jgi:nucleotide-binding universal stress UspA family protein
MLINGGKKTHSK